MLKSFKKTTPLLGCATLLLASSIAQAQVTGFSEDFESLSAASESELPDGNSSLADSGWEVTGNGFYQNSDGTIGDYHYWYGAWNPAPNKYQGGAFSSVTSGEDTKDLSGTQYLNIYNDYDNAAHVNGIPGANYGFVDTIFAKRFTITAADIGKTVTFSFDAKRENVNPDTFGIDQSYAVGNGCQYVCTAGAFIRTQSGGDRTNDVPADMTSISQSDWTAFTITLDLTDPLLEGQELQIGFATLASHEDKTGVYYDNIVVTAGEAEEPESANVPIPTIALLGFGALLAWSGMTSIRKRLS